MTSETHKTALVTGSGRRLGKQIALALAGAGYDIVLHANRSVEGMHAAAREIEALGRRAFTIRADIANVDEALRLGREAVAAAGGLDLLVNNAAIFPTRPFAEVDEALWNTVLDTNLRSMFFVCQACAPALKASRGSIVNFASAGAFRPWTSHIPYNISKAGVVMLTKALAKELAPEVRVNAIAPSIVVIPGEEARPPALPVARIPLGRYGAPSDITEVVLFLARSAAYVTGHVFSIDGGLLTTESGSGF